MFNNHFVKRILSVVLSVCLAISMLSGITVNAAGSGDVLLAGSEEAGYEKLTFSDFGVADGQILNQNSGHSVSSVLEGDLDEVLFRGKFLFPTLESGKKFGNIYIGKANWWGLTLSQDNNGNILVNATSTGSSIENAAATNLTANSPVELRNNPDLELAFSIKYENKTATTTDLKIGVWINGKLQPGGYIIIKNATLSELTRCFHTYDSSASSSVTVASVTGEIKAEETLLKDSAENNYEKLTFSDFGVADGAILAQGNGKHFVSPVLEGDLDEILFQGKYLYPTKEASLKPGNIYLGRGNWWAIGLTMDSAGNILVSVPSGTIENKAITNLTANNPDVQLRNNEDLEIAISVKYENKTATTTDLKIGVWFNGKLQEGGYIIAKNVPLTDLTRCFHTYDTDAGYSVTVASVTDAPTGTLLKDSPENDYEKLTFSDFGVADGQIMAQGNGKHFVSSVLEGDLDEILFQGKYLYPTKEASLKPGNIYLGRGNWWAIGLTMDSAGNILVSVPSGTIENKAITNLTANNPDVQLRNNEDLEIAISVKYENKTATTTDLKIGVWFNGKLQEGGYIIAKNVPLTDLTRCFHTYDTDANSTITVASVGQTVTPPKDILLSESAEKDYEKLTFGHFGVADGEILTQNVGHVASNVLKGDLDEILFQGKYLFPTLEKSVKFGNIYLGKANYYGIALTNDSAGNILLDVITSTTNKSAVENKAATNLTANSQVELRNNPDLEIAISVKYENKTATTTDLKIGVWINGVLQKGGYVYARNVALDDLIRCFHTTDVDVNTTVTVKSVGEVPEPEKILLSESAEKDYEKLTFADFGAMDGELLSGKTGEKVNYATLPGDLDEILFQGKYNFPSLEEAKKFGNIYLGRPDWWTIGFTQDGAGNIIFTVVSDGSSIDNSALCNLTVGNPKVQLRNNEELEIAISVKYENTTETTTDLKIGVWINGVLQQGEYIYARKVLLSDLIRCLHTYDASADTDVGITSVGQWEMHSLPTDFTELTLSDGNIPDGNTVTYGNFSRIESLNKTLVSANVQFNKAGSRMHLGTPGGGVDAYSGLGIRLEGNNLVIGNELSSVEGVQTNELASIGLNFCVINPQLAGMGDTFAQKEFLLQLSTEFVDFDGDGKTNDIKLGVFINGKLYCNSYLYILNEAQTLGTGVNFNGVNEVDFAKFSSVALKELTSTDLGVKNGTYTTAVGGTTSAETLDQTAVTTHVTFGGTGSVSFGKAGKGIVYRYIGSNTVMVSHVKADGTAVEITRVSMPVNKAAELRTTFQFVKAGDKTNLKLGVFVNGKLSGYKYFLVEDVDTSVLTRSMSVLPAGATIRVGANAYEELTLRDFIVADKTRSDYGARFTAYEGANYNNTAFSAVLTFSDETKQANDNCFYVGGDWWYGLRVELDANSQLAIGFVHADGTLMRLARISPEEVGMTTFQGKAFTYRVTFDVVQSAKGTYDAIIGVYINDTLCKGKHLLVKGVDAKVLDRGVFSYIDKNGGSLTMLSTNPAVDFTIFGLTKDWENTLRIQ